MTTAPEEREHIYTLRRINSQYVRVQLLVNDLPAAFFTGTEWRRGAGMINIEATRIKGVKTITDEEAEDIYLDMELDAALSAP